MRRRRGHRLSGPSLFEGDGSTEAEADEPTLTVGELNRVIAEALTASFPGQVWVRGEIQQIVRSRAGHAYFELVEQDEGRDRVRAVLRVALFRDDRARVNRVLKEVPGVRISDGVEVRIRGRVEYYPPSGRLQLVMTGIDPVFTVGRLAADRERLVRALADEGVLRRNAGIELPPVPLRVGLVASGGTAAYRDFVHGLEESGHSFRVAHCDVRVQGAGAPRRIVWALGQLAERGVDAVVVVRGGGARSDLAPFDAERVARAITEMPVPVITGIGHEVDRTVADEVAHTVCKTPSAAAEELVARVDAYCERLAHLAHRVSLRAQHACRLAGAELTDLGRRMERGVPVALDRERRALDGCHRGVLDAGRRGTRAATARADTIAARLRALDPRRVLERGYTITRDGGGAVVRAAAQVGAGDVLQTETAAGSVRSRVEDEDA